MPVGKEEVNNVALISLRAELWQQLCEIRVAHPIDRIAREIPGLIQRLDDVTLFGGGAAPSPLSCQVQMKFGNDADNLVQLVEVSIESFGLLDTHQLYFQHTYFSFGQAWLKQFVAVDSAPSNPLSVLIASFIP